jgi:thiol-disulfide isomerase/thioredoxin
MDLRVCRPKGFTSTAEFDQQYGADLWHTNHEKYAQLSKVEPMLTCFEELGVRSWITGRRRGQGGEREQLQLLEVTEKGELTINPLALNWSLDDVWAYVRDHNLVYNTLYDAGYKSIGDTMTTVAVEPGAAERSGRFRGQNQTECGMHTHLAKVKAAKEKAAADGFDYEMPTLPCADCVDVVLGNFDEMVLTSPVDLLIEFYSPLCQHCQTVAPKFARVSTLLKDKKSSIVVARMDITSNKIPPSGVEAGFALTGYPAMYASLTVSHSIGIALHITHPPPRPGTSCLKRRRRTPEPY